jgi:hypothetical protein
MISSDGGTGGGIFRKMYGYFLCESADMIKNKELLASGYEFVKIGELWDNIGSELMELYNSGKDAIIQNLSPMILEIAEKEEKQCKQLDLITEK